MVCFSISPKDDEMYVKLACVLTMSSILLGQPTISRKLTFCIFYQVKFGLQEYCDTSNPGVVVNQMWILIIKYHIPQCCLIYQGMLWQ